MTYDCVVVGGGAAGLSAALVLGRARRRTLVVDAGRQPNLAAHRIGGLLGFDGRDPEELYRIGRRELAAYPSVEQVAGRVSGVAGATGDFRVDFRGDFSEPADGPAGARRVHARRVLLAPGVDYLPPDLPGIHGLWGSTVFHCPFCHGWEFRDQPMAVLADGDKGLHASLLARAWTADVVLVTDGPAGIDADGRHRLTVAGVRVDERPVRSVRARDGRLSAVVFAGGAELERTALLVATTLRRHSDLAEQLGLVTRDTGPVVVDPIDVDHLGRTTVPGVFAAGDTCTQVPQVATAIATGSVAATAIVQSLLSDDPPLGSGLPFPPRRDETAGRV